MKTYSDEEFFESPIRGVTTVLNTIFGNKYDNNDIPEFILKAAADRGTAVHKYIEEFLNWYHSKEGDEPHVELEYNIYESNFKEWLQKEIDFGIDSIFTEQKIINEKLGVKGIIDCVAVVNTEVCLIDWKTSSGLDLWTTECQLQLYYMLLLKGNKEERDLAKRITSLRCLNLTKSGYRWIKFDINKDLANSILNLWSLHFRKIAEKEKRKK